MIAMLRVAWIVAGCAPGVRRIPSRIRFHWITWSGSVGRAGCFAEAKAPAARKAAAPIAPSAIPSTNSLGENRFIRLLLPFVVLGRAGRAPPRRPGRAPGVPTAVARVPQLLAPVAL